MNLTDLPLEVLENIFHHVDEAKDLLCLALTNKSFSRVIIPFHLQLPRKIRCLTNTTAIWSNLASRPEFCAHIREIHLYDNVVDRTFPFLNPIIPALLRGNDLDIQSLWPQVPRACWKPPHTTKLRFFTKLKSGPRDDSPGLQSPEQPRVELCSAKSAISSLCRILPQVVNLTKFLYSSSSYHNPIIPQILKSLLDTVVCYSSCSLREVTIVWYGQFSQDTLENVFSSLWMLSDLTLFKFEVPFITLGHKDLNDLCNLLVTRCANLEKLCLRFMTYVYSPLLDNLWTRGTWQRLRQLCLGSSITLKDARGDDLFRHLIARHPGLECLEYHHKKSHPVFELLKFNLLKNLQALSLDRISYIPSLSTITPQRHMFENVEYLRIRQQTLDGLGKTYFPSLRVLIIHNLPDSDPGPVSHLYPETLERLCINLDITTDFFYIKPHEFVERFVEKLVRKPSPFNKLTHLCFTTQAHTVSINPFQSKKVLKRIATLPSLKYFGFENHRGEASQAWIRLHRDSFGRYAGYAADNSVELVSRWWNFLGYIK